MLGGKWYTIDLINKTFPPGSKLGIWKYNTNTIAGESIYWRCQENTNEAPVGGCYETHSIRFIWRYSRLSEPNLLFTGSGFPRRLWRPNGSY